MNYTNLHQVLALPDNGSGRIVANPEVIHPSV
jgi:hypothetical protein